MRVEKCLDDQLLPLSYNSNWCSNMEIPTKSATPVDKLGLEQKLLSIEELTQRNVETISRLEEASKEQYTRSDRVAALIARFCGSIAFVWVSIIWFGGWIVFNVLPGVNHIDPFPFTFLTLMVSLEAIFLSTFILINQNRQTKVSDKRNHLDLQINLLSEQENTQMLALLQLIAAKVGVDVAHDSHARILEQETSAEKLVAQIEETEASSTKPALNK